MSEKRNGTRPGVIFEARDVAVHFGGVKAVDGLSIALHEGQITGILGPNGSGKSTLVGAITRHVPLTRGTLTFLGEDYKGDRPHTVPHRGIARTFQTVRLLEERTVRDNVLLGTDALVRGGRSARREAQERAERAMERTGCAQVADERPDELSYGMRRRVEIARAIAMDPKLLLLDEPTAGMNRPEREEISRRPEAPRRGGWGRCTTMECACAHGRLPRFTHARHASSPVRGRPTEPKSGEHCSEERRRES